MDLSEQSYQRFIDLVYEAAENPERWRHLYEELQTALDVLGPAGLYAANTFGAWLLPVLIVPLLMIGGTYLAFEATEKILEKLTGDHHDELELLEADLGRHVHGLHGRRAAVRDAGGCGRRGHARGRPRGRPARSRRRRSPAGPGSRRLHPGCGPPHPDGSARRARTASWHTGVPAGARPVTRRRSRSPPSPRRASGETTGAPPNLVAREPGRVLAALGNQDRHEENWAVLRSPDAELSLAPAGRGLLGECLDRGQQVRTQPDQELALRFGLHAFSHRGQPEVMGEVDDAPDQRGGLEHAAQEGNALWA